MIEQGADFWVSDPALGSDATLAERTYIRLRDDIIKIKLPPGALLRENELMDRLDTGRTPIREAIQRLHQEGFVTIAARRGSFVSNIVLSDLTAVYEARARIESWATRLATQRLTDRERILAKALIEKLENSPAPMDLDAVLSLDRQIHRFIYQAAKNSYLLVTLDHYHNLSLRILYFAVGRFPSLLPNLNKVLHEQIVLLKAVCDGDADSAERIAMHHVVSFEVEARKVL